MAWTIEFARKADKQLDKLNPHDAARIVKMLEEVALLDDPRDRGHSLTGDLAVCGAIARETGELSRGSRTSGS